MIVFIWWLWTELNFHTSCFSLFSCPHSDSKWNPQTFSAILEFSVIPSCDSWSPQHGTLWCAFACYNLRLYDLGALYKCVAVRDGNIICWRPLRKYSLMWDVFKHVQRNVSKNTDHSFHEGYLIRVVSE